MSNILTLPAIISVAEGEVTQGYGYILAINENNNLTIFNAEDHQIILRVGPDKVEELHSFLGSSFPFLTDQREREIARLKQELDRLTTINMALNEVIKDMEEDG